MSGRTVTLTVTRYRPEQEDHPERQSYTVPYDEDMVVLDALNFIKDQLDGTLSFRWSCRMGICGSCGMNVNGTPKLTCAAFLREYYPNEIVVEPLVNFPIIRDLVVDISDFLAKLGAVQPWMLQRQDKPLSAGEYLQTPAEVEQYRQFSMCINCMLCYAACPVYGLEPDFIGPAALALAHRYDMDSRDAGRAARLPTIASSVGIWECTYVGECSVVCPKNVDPAAAIQRMKLAATADWYGSLLMPWARRAK
ncbi:MAG TPA: succinate dehydrogenase/fumarate reductase iron-sulfur subunit [Chloroflexota bacterium]|jgi:fumarate reductase iron-sulfur subunit|nr:succinate dehydrogenase/fumarate reductase iron-sulfur subunit [Chloroflexota bacterium]